MYQRLKNELMYLKKYHLLAGLKAGTEVEGMDFNEIKDMRDLSCNILPLTVKIGGPEARNDIRFAVSIKADMILAPMVESEYGFKNFITTALELEQKSVLLAINIETITAYINFSKIVLLPEFHFLQHITVGRSDLSCSMHAHVDDEEVIIATNNIIKAAKENGKTTSVGGKINPDNASVIQSIIRPHYINTRHMIINCSSANISEDVLQALRWEKLFYEFLSKKYPERSNMYKKRISSIEDRYKENIVVTG